MFGIYIDRSSSIPRTAQLCHQLRQKITSGELRGGTRLPSTRKVAQDFGIARNVVIDAYEQLIAEGYLIGHTGSGTYVAEGIIAMSPAASDTIASTDNLDRLTVHERNDIIDFLPGTPDLHSFPRTIWAKYLKSAAEDSPDEIFDYGDIKGEVELRSEISAYLYRTRGMKCHTDQIMIVSGSSEGLSLIANTMRDHYHSIYLEDPTIEFSHHIFTQVDYQIKPIDVDEAGMKLPELKQLAEGHLMLLTPSHQFPTGSILSIQRRQLAVRMAEQANMYIIEDDYDSDFRLKGVPIPPLYSLLPDRVIYVGTFSKTLAPGLRIGFLVLPQQLIDPFVQAREEQNLRSPTVAQIALGRFIRDGRLDRHIHKMKKIYRNKRNLLVGAIKQYFREQAIIKGDEAGVHIRVVFPSLTGDVDWQDAEQYGVRIHGVEDYCLIKSNHHNQIVLGYGNVNEQDIQLGIERLHQYWQSLDKNPNASNNLSKYSGSDTEA